MRLIDADALQNILLPITTALEHEYGSLGGAVSGCMKHIDNAPTIDAVPVVRRRECKYRFKNNGHDKNGCPIIDANIWMDDDDFCSYGERKEGTDDVRKHHC